MTGFLKHHYTTHFTVPFI